jgi:hypothetical protein
MTASFHTDLAEATTDNAVQAAGSATRGAGLGSVSASVLDWCRRPVGTVVLFVAIWSLALDVIAVLGARFIAGVPHPGRSALTAAWQQWDGNWFERIVAGGYHYFPEQIPGHGAYYLQAAFYPGFPVVARGVYEIVHPLGVGVTGAMLLTNQVLIFALALLFYRLALVLTGDRAVGVRAVQYLLLFPFAYFLLAPYSETVFMTCLAGFSWALVTRRYGVAALFGAAASATRLVGIVLPVIVVVAYLEQHDWQLRSIRPRIVIYALTPLAGAAAYALYQWAEFGDPLYSQHASKLGWARSFTLNIWRVVRESFGHQPLSAGYIHGVPLEAFVIWPLLIAFVALSVAVWRRFGAALGLLCVLLMLESITSGSMLSFNRYLLPLLPCFIVLAVIGRNSLFDSVYRMFGSLLLGLFLVMFVHAIWTG